MIDVISVCARILRETEGRPRVLVGRGGKDGENASLRSYQSCQRRHVWNGAEHMHPMFRPGGQLKTHKQG